MALAVLSADHRAGLSGARLDVARLVARAVAMPNRGRARTPA